MDTALPQKFPFILDRNLAKANCTGNRVCTPCDTVVLGLIIRLYIYIYTLLGWHGIRAAQPVHPASERVRDDPAGYCRGPQKGPLAKNNRPPAPESHRGGYRHFRGTARGKTAKLFNLTF